jgi:acetamidase/formamidase
MSGCGEGVGTAEVDDAIVAEVITARQNDRLTRLDEVDPGSVDAFLSARGRDRRRILKTGGLLGALAAVGPSFLSASRAEAEPAATTKDNNGGGGSDDQRPGRTHVVGSDSETVRLGVFDTTLPNLLEIESGDRISYVDTWSHFLNQLQPGVPIDTLAALRLANPGRGPHSIIGPIGVRGAELGDVVEIQYERVQPFEWAANFNNPGSLNTGALPDLFPDGQVRYFNLDLREMSTAFNEDITLPLAPFQGTLGLAPPPGFVAPAPPGSPAGVVSSVPPGPHGGNVDLSELTEGSKLFIPVWLPGAKIYTGDSHALQGDGEVNLTALETRLRELRIRVLLHKQVNNALPIAETPSHWIVLGFDRDLSVAFRTCLIQAIEFLNRRAGLTRLDAYALCSLAVSFRITQVVDINKGVHAMIPKHIFRPERRQQISVA